MTVQTAQQARLLLDMGYGPLLGVVMTGEASASEVARQAGLTLKRTHHRLTRLLEAGLVFVSAEQKRRGRAVKLYRAAADTFTVPFGLTDAATLEELMVQMYRPFMDSLIRNQAVTMQDERGDVRLRLDSARQLMYNFGPRPEPDELRRAYGTAGTTMLLPQDALYLRGELRRLREWATERYSASDDARSYLLGLIFTPGGLEQ